eukprot:TRINITY_DN5420_c0_g1_i6.p2 TRINITY_DN5420_c0_g1~~TRINITY_DN5420_c0_g1_i6.p2  ORF type:complete len:444 (+),score=64.35 TRINITY_DN5420_c0_g1_i6:164-1495(+)
MINSLGSLNQFDIVQNTTNFIMENLINEDYFGLVTFDEQVQELIKMEMFTEQDLIQYQQIVNGLQLQGRSDMVGGVVAGLEQHQQLRLNENFVRGTIIVSDGYADFGVTDPGMVEAFVAAKFNSLQDEVRMFPVATSGAQFDLLDSIAKVGQGALLYLSRVEDLQKAFGLQFGGLISTYYQDVIMKIAPQPGVTIGKISTGGKVSTTPVNNENHYQVIFDDLRADEARDLLVELQYEEGQAEPELLISVTVDYVFYIDDINVGDTFTVTSSEGAPDRDPLIDVSLLRFQTTEILSKSKTVQNQAEVEEVIQQAQQVGQLLEDFKQGGILEQLQNPPAAQSLEISPGGGKRKLLQSSTESEAQGANFLSLFETLNLTIIDTIDIVRQVAGFLDDTSNEDLNDLLRLLVTLDSLQISLDSQRLEIVPPPEFKAAFSSSCACVGTN